MGEGGLAHAIISHIEIPACDSQFIRTPFVYLLARLQVIKTVSFHETRLKKNVEVQRQKYGRSSFQTITGNEGSLSVESNRISTK